MSVKIRFFARFRELFGADVVTDVVAGTMFTSLITMIAKKNPEDMLPSLMRQAPSTSS